MLFAPRIPAVALLLGLAASFSTPPAQAQKAASEVLVSQSGSAPSAATDGHGGFVITWIGRGIDSSDILASVLPKGAARPRAPFVVNTSTSGYQVAPDVAVDAAGRFAMVWQDGLEFSGNGAGDARVAGASFGAAGGRQSPGILLSPSGTDLQLGPQVAMQENGDYVAAWTEDRAPRHAIKSARFSANGSRLGPEMEMKAGGEINLGARVASFPGGFAVGWSEFFDCSGGRTPAFIGAVARFDTEGRRTAGIYRVGSSRCDFTGPGALLALVGSRAGALAVFAGTQDAAQRFAPSGEPVVGRFLLPSQTCTENHCTALQTVALDNSGRFAAVWETADLGSYSLAVQLFNPRGKPLTGLVPLGGPPSQTFIEPAAALADDGTLAVAWRREIAGDSEHTGLYMTRLRLP